MNRIAFTLKRLFLCGIAAVLAGVVAALPAAADSTSTPPQRTFSYGTILTSLDDAHFAHDGGFNVMSAYIAWSSVEPTRGQYIFEGHDQWGQTSANDLTNVVNAARSNNLKVGLRLDSPP